MRARLLAPALIVVTCTVRDGGVIAPFVLLAHFKGAQPVFEALVDRARYSRAVLLSLAAVALAYGFASTWHDNRAQTAWLSKWTALGKWARSQTLPTASFLIPTVDLIASNRNYSPLAEAADIGPSTFEFALHRRVWNDDSGARAVRRTARLCVFAVT